MRVKRHAEHTPYIQKLAKFASSKTDRNFALSEVTARFPKPATTPLSTMITIAPMAFIIRL
ncbi:hypothetical protein C1875_11015 [Eggerthella lenta]|uniref:Uncharacterized protein n=1 Tax=Eggerthella lenta TaxID=84112 RepID=A0A369MB80_EGGLN|nr:hypothetical protein C1875_11015 [Eggerthella lenta]